MLTAIWLRHKEKPESKTYPRTPLEIPANIRRYRCMELNALKENADRAEALLKSLASRNRLMILCTLVEGERSVGALAASLGVRESVVSQHLAILRREGLVANRREGQTIYYALSNEDAKRLLDTLYSIFCDGEEERGRSDSGH